MQNIKVLDRQCLLDISIQGAGGIEYVFDIAQWNGMSITEMLSNGLELDIPVITTSSINKATVSLLSRNPNQPASMDSSLDAPSGGIGSMGVGLSFKIS